MAVKVAIPGIWRGLTGGAATVDCQGTTMLEVLLDLARVHPAMYNRLFTPAGEAKRHVHCFLNNKAVTDLTAPVRPGDEILLLMAIAGG